MKLLRVLSVSALAVFAASAALAQAPPRRPSEWFGGGGLLVGVPLGDFADATDEGFGLVGNVVFTPGRGPFGIRLQTGALVYGSRKIHPSVPGTGGLVTQEVTTENWLLNAGLGVQLTARSGSVRPYVYALAGLGYFATDTSLGDGYDDHYWDNTTTNYDDTTFAWSAGAGLLFPLSRSLALDVGVQYVGNGTVSYLAEGDLQPSASGAPPVVVPRRTAANLVTLTIGLSLGY